MDNPHIIRRTLALMAVLAFPFCTLASPEAPRPQIMVLGTFHFEGSPTDGVSVTMGDMLSERRQEEIEVVVSRLQRFRPTMIAVEATPESSAALDQRYQAYRNGRHELGANEIEQLGMRLAKRLGLEKLHAVDARQDMDFERMMKAGASAGQEEILGWFQQTIGGIEQSLAQAQGPDKSLVEALRFHNGPWAFEGHRLYIKLAQLGTDADPAGAEVIGGWYERNLKIHANIARAISRPDERVLVIFGSGHLPLLAHFFEESPDHDYLPALTVLSD